MKLESNQTQKLYSANNTKKFKLFLLPYFTTCYSYFLLKLFYLFKLYFKDFLICYQILFDIYRISLILNQKLRKLKSIKTCNKKFFSNFKPTVCPIFWLLQVDEFFRSPFTQSIHPPKNSTWILL